MNHLPLIPAPLLRTSNKILFIAHLALGDFTYLQNCFAAFKRAYPHLEVHIWVDEVRRTTDARRWPQLEKYALYDWLAACPFFSKVYSKTYSPQLFDASLQEARAEQYPIVVSLATLRPHMYAGIARAIAPAGFVVGMRAPFSVLAPHHLLAWRKLDATLSPNPLHGVPGHHISDVYADWFHTLSGMQISPEQRLPFVLVPDAWQLDARTRLADWGFAGKGPVVFVNPFAKTKKRCWPLERVAALIAAMQQRAEWAEACFIVNAMPHELENARAVVSSFGLARTQFFSATDNFFQLPAMLAECDLIVSVETAVMHLANAVHVPVVALMRQKNPEWVPVDRAHSTVITAAHRRDWVKEIQVQAVLDALP
ncbi:glycosyltransferase family 9 protein [Massilia sp. S19_KUP03_FR1]|uniref:glycosyltransferase family 9 protein n=1 Tax=Massilia sp. S19_KUP03_FR1 TaxID=3025503 RepID=UPI002FCD91E5